MVTEHEDKNTLLVTPISHYLTLEQFVPLKSHPDTFDNTAEDKIEERLMKLAKADDTTPSSALDGKKDPSKTRKRLVTSGNIGWDYDGDVPSDDEEMYPQTKTEVSEDPFGYQTLSIYGHRLKSLLAQQEEREADDELKQYSDCEDTGSQVSVGSRTKSQDKAKSSAKKPKVEEKPSGFEEKIMRFLKQNMGRVTVKVRFAHELQFKIGTWNFYYMVTKMA
ncbi:hypothetical protein BEWA_026480 [Theileria equi strain WA]|uniref:Uncharacterized protein n=1 Tax=Theileria equi strain WA TaxID=1537102 RepID=L0AY08_THEEQ|nr:hypothetical protein BEWA_026480 [Theileria equi strain WA]AFZ79799.1 hypothetical protein BEWA_026480 [Theileria equi strain WA]|eukprot:XP_004829465.1 hypothetical protein BEWA_026480 [Theileria equi strain WA]